MGTDPIFLIADGARSTCRWRLPTLRLKEASPKASLGHKQGAGDAARYVDRQRLVRRRALGRVSGQRAEGPADLRASRCTYQQKTRRSGFVDCDSTACGAAQCTTIFLAAAAAFFGSVSSSTPSVYLAWAV